MHLADLLAKRPVPAAGVFLTLTRRCPLTCAHCSTNSMLDSEEHEAKIFSDFAATFTPEDRPDIVLLTGGEPLLRPDLVMSITHSAQAAGAAVQIITGLYFARTDGRIPPRLLTPLLAVDHVTTSMDIFHERQVPRDASFAVIRTLVDAGQDVSVQLVGRGADDPYLVEVTRQIREEFDDRVPALVAPLGSVGRARAWLEGRTVHRDQLPVPSPCMLAAWPVVGFDGTLLACCNQDIVDGPAPGHLRLGSAQVTTWAEVAAAVRRRSVLRALRTLGPEVIAHTVGVAPSERGYCGTCARLSDSAALESSMEEMISRPTFPVIESEVARMASEAGPASIARRYGIAEYAHMLNLGYPTTAPVR